MLGMGPSVDLSELVKGGAVILDVRTKGEYAGGHVKGSVNIPLNVLSSQMDRFKKDQAIITCCASGMRSGSAKGLLKDAGFTNVHNGGPWTNVAQYKK